MLFVYLRRRRGYSRTVSSGVFRIIANGPERVSGRHAGAHWCMVTIDDQAVRRVAAMASRISLRLVFCAHAHFPLISSARTIARQKRPSA